MVETFILTIKPSDQGAQGPSVLTVQYFGQIPLGMDTHAIASNEAIPLQPRLQTTVLDLIGTMRVSATLAHPQLGKKLRDELKDQPKTN